MDGTRFAYRMLGRKPYRKRSLGRSFHIFEENIKMDVR
jgi:hypothetical protein